jgi:hypothetical protein
MTVFSLKLRTAAQGNDAVRALRRLLKYAKRVCGLTCIDAREETSPIPAQPESGRAIPANEEK